MCVCGNFNLANLIPQNLLTLSLSLGYHLKIWVAKSPYFRLTLGEYMSLTPSQTVPGPIKKWECLPVRSIASSHHRSELTISNLVCGANRQIVQWSSGANFFWIQSFRPFTTPFPTKYWRDIFKHAAPKAPHIYAIYGFFLNFGLACTNILIIQASLLTSATVMTRLL